MKAIKGLEEGRNICTQYCVESIVETVHIFLGCSLTTQIAKGFSADINAQYNVYMDTKLIKIKIDCA